MTQSPKRLRFIFQKSSPIRSQLPSIAILLIGVISIFLVKEWAWNGITGKDYQQIIDSDAKGYYMYLPHIFLDHSLSHQQTDNRYIFNLEGGAVNKYFGGTALMMLPFFGLGYSIAYLQGDDLDGYSPPFQKAISIAGIFYFLAGLFFLSRLLRLFEIHDSIIAIVLLLIAFGTNLLTYAIISPGMSHVYSWFVITAFLFVVKKLIQTKRTKYLYSGAILFGIIVLIRPLNGLILFAVPFLTDSYTEFKSFIKTNSALKSTIIAFILVTAIVIIQPVLWYIQSGSFFIWSYKDEGFNFTRPQIVKVLFSFRKGLFIYTPMVLLALAGSLFWFRKNRFRFNSLFIFLIILLYFISSWWNWYYGPSFSQRPFVEFYAIAGLLLAALFTHIRTLIAKISIYFLAIAFVVLNMVQTYQYKYYILSTWDMSFEKYNYVFLKTSEQYRSCLGGNDDLVPYNSNLKLCYHGHFGFEQNKNECSVSQTLYDPVSRSIVADYSGREFDVLVEPPVTDSMLTDRGLFAEIHLSRFENDRSSCSYSYFVIDYSDSQSKNYYYYAFLVNETPSMKTASWKNISYTVELPKLQSADDIIKLYVWNPKKLSFYIDNLDIRLYSVN